MPVQKDMSLRLAQRPLFPNDSVSIAVGVNRESIQTYFLT